MCEPQTSLMGKFWAEETATVKRENQENQCVWASGVSGRVFGQEFEALPICKMAPWAWKLLLWAHGGTRVLSLSCNWVCGRVTQL